MSFEETNWCKSKFLVLIPLDEHWTCVSHSVIGIRRFLNRDEMTILNVLEQKSSSVNELSNLTSLPLIRVTEIIEQLHEVGFIQHLSIDEDEEVGNCLRAEVHALQFMERHATTLLGGGFLSSTTDLGYSESIDILLLGNCYAEMLGSHLESSGKARGIAPNVKYTWPEQLQILTTNSFNIVYYQPFNVWLLRSFLDNWLNYNDVERSELLVKIQGYLSAELNRIHEHAGDALIIIQALATPSFGPTLYDEPFVEVFVRNLNETLRQECNRLERTRMLDTNRLFSRFGTLFLLDDMVAPISHQTPLHYSQLSHQKPSFKVSFKLHQRINACRLLAEEVFDLYSSSFSLGNIKLIVVDLDGTLWDGQAADPHFTLTDGKAYENFRYGVYGGIHQALKWLQQRGILLATCSKNEESVVMSHWHRLDSPKITDLTAVSSAPDWEEDICQLDFLLRSHDFVAHRINWKPKSENIIELSRLLKIPLNSMLYIDNNPVELAEVQYACPNIQLLGPDINMIRYSLLTDPRVQPTVTSNIGKNRSETTKVGLQHLEEKNKYSCTKDFLASLQIRFRILHIDTSSQYIDRISELLLRTNQFKTTDFTLSPFDLRRWLDQIDNTIYALEVSDRYANYGIVGTCLVQGQEIIQYAISCRVLGLEVGVPFLVACIQSESSLPLIATVIPNARNVPCHGVFKDAGFYQEGENTYRLEYIDQLSRIDTEIYNLM